MIGLERLSPALRVFLTCWIAYSLHFATDIVREHYPAFSLGERATLRVDPYLGLHPDLFEIEGRGAFINNNPGASLVGALPYALFRPAVDLAVERVQAGRAQRGDPGEIDTGYSDDRPLRREFFRKVREQGLDVRFGLAAGIIQAFGTAPIAAAAVALMYLLLLRMGFAQRESTWLALLYGLATPVFFRAGFLNHNLLGAHATLAAFALLYEPDRVVREPARLAGAGFALGFGLLCDYAGVIPLLVLGSYGLAKLWARDGFARALPRSLWMVAGALPPVSGLLAYQWWAFGAPWFPAQHYMPDTHLSVHGWNGFGWPAPDMLLRNLFDPAYGLFSFGPLLLLGLAAPFVRTAKSQVPRAEQRLAIALFVSLLVFTSANQFARLQWNTGFRMLAPIVPLLFPLAAAVWVRLPRRIAFVLAGLALLHQWCLAMVRADAFESVAVVFTQGPRLPWLTSMWRAGGAYLPLLEDTGPQAWPLLLIGFAAIATLWWPGRVRR